MERKTILQKYFYLTRYLPNPKVVPFPACSTSPALIRGMKGLISPSKVI